jgi:3-deoxy-D-manno-octulosonate 8-phosphate phosphatase (KDO 8-P phosphatase)
VLEIHKKMSSIKLLAFDVDGVLTDNNVWMNEVGQWRRMFSVRDGYGIQMLRELRLSNGIHHGQFQ